MKLGSVRHRKRREQSHDTIGLLAKECNNLFMSDESKGKVDSHGQSAPTSNGEANLRAR